MITHIPCRASLAFVLLGAATCLGQSPIQWQANAEDAVAQARSTSRPLLFYVPGTSDAEDSDLEDAIQQTFRDATVRRVVAARFVPARLQRSSQTDDLLQRLGAPLSYGLYLLVVTPEGDLVGRINPRQAASAPNFVRKLTELFREYRKNLFDKTLKDRLEEESASLGDKRIALRIVREFLIVSADDVVVDLLDDKVPDALRQDAYETLAALSTEKSVDTLLEAAAKKEAAARILDDCTVGGAKYMLDALDPSNPEKLKLAAEAVAEICDIPDAKPTAFWGYADPAAQRKEIRRLKRLVRDQAQAWQERYGPLR